MRLLYIIFILSTSTFLLGQSDYETLKSSFIDSLIKKNLTEIIIFQTGTIGQRNVLSRDTVNGERRECFFNGEFLALWKENGKLYAKKINQCSQSDRLLLKSYNNLTSVASNLSNLKKLKVASDRDAIIISGDTIEYSMSCDTNYVSIDHYQYKLLEVHTKVDSYNSGPINKFIFCNPQTKTKAEVIDLQRRIEAIENIINRNNIDDVIMHKTIKNWH